MLDRVREQQRLLGRRVRFREQADITAYWRRSDPTNWHPSDGMTGTIAGWPPPGELGSGPRIRWDNGRITYLGSGQRYELL